MTRGGRGIFVKLTETALCFFVWPLRAVALLFEFAKYGRLQANTGGHNDVALELTQLLVDIESVSHSGATTTLFEFRDVFTRYTGLAIAASDDDPVDTAADLFGVAGHPNPDIATVCLARKSRARLRYHLSLARADFVESFVGLTHRNERAKRLEGLAEMVAATVGDEYCIELFRERFDKKEATRNDRLSGDEMERIWISPEQTRTAAS